MDINLKTLIGKLNDTTRAAASRAASICVGLGHYEVEIEHLFLGLIEQPDSDLAVIARQCNISLTGLETDLRKEIARFATGNARTPVFSKHLPALFEHAWLIASLGSGHPNQIRSAHLLLALLTEPSLAQLAQRASREFARFPLDRLKHDLERLTRGSRETPALAAQGAGCDSATATDAATELTQAPVRGTPALDQYTTCLTARAREGKVDPVIGRDAEIRQAIDILMRRRQNNPILTGEAGVGKTAVVEGLALRIAQGEVPDVLKGVEIHTLDMGLLQAGASVKGEFENRLKNVIDEVKKSPHAIILFIDEAHTMIGAGGQAGQNDAANLLKPALARGELRTIAATTWGEYKKYFEKDAALARRFQVIKVEEPSEDIACAMLRAMAPLMERHFNVRVYDDAITEAVRLSHRYIAGRQLPDKAISVLDTACAKVALGQSATPALLEDCSRRIERIVARIAALEREASAGGQHGEALGELRRARDSATDEQQTLRHRWEQEQALTAQIGQLRAGLEAGRSQGGDGAEPRAELCALIERLRALQGESPLVPVQVDGHTVAEIVAAWTGIPLGRMVKDEIRTVVKLQSMLDQRILGQQHASGVVAQRVRTVRANLDDPNKPKGVFLFVGTSGVGKTETALALADILYGGERKLVTINMSEYQEAHSVSGLKGSPPGYVGYGEGGVLTEAVRRNPYSVVLLDEAEKAHPDVLELFFQVFDKGVMDDAEGRQIDFRNTIIILTSNLGSGQLMQACLNKPASELPAPDQLSELLRPALMKHFKPAFLGRLTVVPFYPIRDEVLSNIIRLKLDRIGARIQDNHRAHFEYDDALVTAVLNRCTEVDSGARNVDKVLNGSLLPEIADSVLARMAEGGGIARVKVSATKAGKFKYTVEATASA
ncbi:type VI secretion system ATPase TssH [Massilia sp. ST3]|uniref:type VI secretion system ATPase TssH n=1 Tax=Massilia sp. ST3 TaxID=2824903 RepID=UPI001B833081|nr:type VI secretion system ATPase TssH [Massilia sp. ST3]MBQ5949658.1 type VI secretion system ATPase TssH [Massilia sp. ST3]